jgi:hypothetical protein
MWCSGEMYLSAKRRKHQLVLHELVRYEECQSVCFARIDDVSDAKHFGL